MNLPGEAKATSNEVVSLKIRRADIDGKGTLAKKSPCKPKRTCRWMNGARKESGEQKVQHGTRTKPGNDCRIERDLHNLLHFAAIAACFCGYTSYYMT